MKFHLPKIVIASAGLIHAGVTAPRSEFKPDDTPPERNTMSAPPSACPGGLDGARVLSLMSAVLGLGLAIGAMNSDDDRDDEPIGEGG